MQRKALISITIRSSTWHLGVRRLWWVWGLDQSAFTKWWGLGPFVLRETRL